MKMVMHVDWIDIINTFQQITL